MWTVARILCCNVYNCIANNDVSDVILTDGGVFKTSLKMCV